MNKDKLLNELSKINLRPEDYIVIGSGLLAALELREVEDIDLILSEQVFREYEQKGGWSRKDFDDGSYFLARGIYEIGLDWDSDGATPNLDDLKNDEMMIDGVPFISPKRLISWKSKKARPKDLADISLLEDYLSK